MKTRLVILSLLAISAAALQTSRAAAAGLPASIPLEVLFGNPVQQSAQISPDGDVLAFLAPSAEGVMNVWTRAVGESTATMITAEPHRGIREFHWVPDSRRIVYLQDSDGDENYHIVLVDPATGMIRDLTPFSGVKAVNLILGADQVLVGLNLRNPQLFDMYRIDLETGAVTLDTENPGDVIHLLGYEWIADENLVIRAIRAMNLSEGGYILRVRDGRDAPWRELQRWPWDSSIMDGFVAGIAPDGAALYVLSSLGSDKLRLVTIDMSTGRELAVVAADDRCDLWIENILVHPSRRTIQAASFSYMMPEWQVYDEGIAADFARLREGHRGHFRVTSRDKADSKWTVTYDVDNGPASSFLFDRETRELRFLFDDRPDLLDYTLAEMKPVVIKARDGLEMVSYLTLPVGLPPHNLPMVLYVHGGPTARDEWGFEPRVQLLANCGYAVLQVNFRGTVGFGKRFEVIGHQQLGVGSMQNDLTDAVRWAIREGIADSNRIGIFGGSYGGYATLAGLTFTPGLYSCGAEACGPSNVATFLASVPAYWGPMKGLMVQWFGNAEEDTAYNQTVSPFFHIQNIRAPLLIGQGANDPRCKMQESDQIVEAMRKRNLPVTYVVYTDEGHGWRRPENKLDFNSRLAEFFGQHLGGRFWTHEPIEGTSAELR
ncbi:MAG TPA: S9 family peptidase [Acidobacteriota bacterium]|nr:S9 family peptidase [Acidobacteriota bacterium]